MNKEKIVEMLLEKSPVNVFYGGVLRKTYTLTEAPEWALEKEE